MKEYIFPYCLTEYFKEDNGESVFTKMKKLVDDNPDTYYMKWDNIVIVLYEKGMEKHYPKVDFNNFMNPYYGEYIKECEENNIKIKEVKGD